MNNVLTLPVSKPPIIQEWDAKGEKHRLRNTETLQVSAWAHYRWPAYLQGVVGWTAYYGVAERTGTPDEFVRLMAGVESGNGSIGVDPECTFPVEG